MINKHAGRGNSNWMGATNYSSDLKVLIDVTARMHRAESLSQCAEVALEGSVRIALADECCLHLVCGEKFRNADADSFPSRVHPILPVESHFKHSFDPVLLGAGDVICTGSGQDLSCVLIPVVGRNERLHGVFQLVRRKNDAFSVERICNLKNLGLSLAIAIENLGIDKVPIRIPTRENTHDEVQRLRQALAASEAASLAKSRYLASISHEIRNPLGVILGLSEVALDNLQLPVETREYLSGIRRNGKQLSNILGKVLDISKIEAGRLEVEVLEFDTHDFLNTIREDFVPSLSAKTKVCFELKTSQDLPRSFRTDPTKLRQILINLLNNALKFTDSGEIALIVESTDSARALRFRVRDTGIGISLEDRDKLFRPFSQVEASTSRRFGGSGLGLMLSQQLARALGGELALGASEVNRGSEFTLELPIRA